MKKHSLQLRNLVMSALFAALIYVSTRFFQIPIPATGGYIHPGDCLCLLAAWMLPLPYGIAASAI
ncbi:MAG: ECF transporter S component, partial [Clostridia bacterium]|nr:ECF transporter S component [Clostridia bacterium]